MNQYVLNLSFNVGSSESKIVSPGKVYIEKCLREQNAVCSKAHLQMRQVKLVLVKHVEFSFR